MVIGEMLDIGGILVTREILDIGEMLVIRRDAELRERDKKVQNLLRSCTFLL